MLPLRLHDPWLQIGAESRLERVSSKTGSRSLGTGARERAGQFTLNLGSDGLRAQYVAADVPRLLIGSCPIYMRGSWGVCERSASKC